MSALPPTPAPPLGAAVPVAHVAANRALQATARQVAALLRAIPSAEIPIPHSEWTVAEAAIHLVSGTRLYLDCIQGQPSPVTDLAALPEMNRRLFRDFPTRDAGALAGLLDEAVAAYVAATATARGDEPIPWHLGYALPVGALTALLVGEYVLHGYDMARATRRRWPIAPDHARCAIAGLAAVLPLAVDPIATRDVNLCYELVVRGGPRFICHFQAGQAYIEPPGAGPVDCRFTVEPVPYLLAAYGRRSQWPAILRGQIRTGGRKPWLALHFQRLLRRI